MESKNNLPGPCLISKLVTIKITTCPDSYSGQGGLDHEHGCAGCLSLLEHVSSPSVQDTVDSSHSILGTLNFHLVNRLHQPGLRSDHGGVQGPPCGGDDLAATTMDSVSMECNIIKVKPCCTQILVTKNTLLGCPLEASNNGVLDFIQVLNSLSAVNH